MNVTTENVTDEIDRETATLVVGAGPAGLAAARALLAQGLDYDHVERHSAVGGLWDIDAPGGAMYRSAHFNSSRTLSGFGGFPMGDDLPDYPRQDQILRYLREFADAYGLTARIRLECAVESVESLDDGLWRVVFSDGRVVRYRAVVCCSGAQWTPNEPPVPGWFDGEVRHAMTYRDTSELSGRRVLVVGGGASACDIASDAAGNAEHAVVSMRRGYWFIPKHVFGRPADVFGESGPRLPARMQQAAFALVLRWLNGDVQQLGLQKPDHRLFETHPVVNSTLLHHLRHGDLVARPGIETTSGRTVTFTDGTTDEIDLIIQATGYRHTVAYAQDLFGNEQHPDLYLSAFSREHPNLFGIGFVETNSGAFPIFDLTATMIAGHLADQTRRPRRADEFRRLVATDRPDLSGGFRFDTSPRHRGYVDSHAMTSYLRTLVRRMGWRAAAEAPRVPRAAVLADAS